MRDGVLAVVVFVFCAGTAWAQTLVINEVMSSNARTLADEDGDYPDWLELLNNGSIGIDLRNYALSDDAGDLQRWRFPSRVLAPGEFLVVFASGKNRAAPGASLHTNFSIKEEGEPLLLSSPSGALIDRFEPRRLRGDISAGRQPDGVPAWFYFDAATPGAANTTQSYSGFLAVTLSPEAGFYTGSVTVTLTPNVADALIRYTRDGSEPTPEDPLYTGPVDVASTGVLRARAYRAGWIPSEIVTRTYFIDEQTTLPVVSLSTEPANLWDPATGIYVNYREEGPDWERPIHVEFFEPDRRPGFRLDGGVRMHGQGGNVYPQKTLRIYARGEYGTSWIEYPIFPDKPIGAYKRFLLRNSGNDWPDTMFRDAMIQSLMDGTDLDRQAYRPSIVFINGAYWGIHNIRERIDEYYLSETHGIAPEQIDLLEKNHDVMAGDDQHYVALLDYIKSHDLAVPEHYAYVATQMDMANYIDYQIIEIYARNGDWPGNNIRYWRPRTSGSRWKWVLFDTDHGFPQGLWYQANHLEWATRTDGWGDWVTFLFRNLLRNDEFRRQFVLRFADHLNTTFLPERVIARIDAMRAGIAAEMPRHRARWGNPQYWDREVQVLRDFAAKRPPYQWKHLVDFFVLEGTATVTLDVAKPGGGTIRFNTVELPEGSYPWRGIHFRGIPILIEARAASGYRFAGWDGLAETTSALQWTFSGDTTLTARFELDPAQVVPRPFVLAEGPYRFDAWNAEAPAGTYPPNILLQQMDQPDPGLEVEPDGAWTLSYDLASHSRINGLGEQGLAFLNTSNPQEEPGAGYLGAALLALDTRGQETVRVTWTGGTVLPNSRTYGIRLQYRVGATGPFLDLADPAGQPVEYLRSTTPGHAQVFGPILLPPIAKEQPLVQLRWKYYFVETGTTGPRAQLRLDDIVVTGESDGPTPTPAAGNAAVPFSLF